MGSWLLTWREECLPQGAICLQSHRQCSAQRPDDERLVAAGLHQGAVQPLRDLPQLLTCSKLFPCVRKGTLAGDASGL